MLNSLRLGLTLLALLAFASVADAQSNNARVVPSCGGSSLATGPAVIQVDPTGKLCVNATVSATATFTVVTSTATDRSLSVTTGGTSQALMASNGARKGYLIQNFGCGSTANGNIYIGIGLAASTSDGKSILLPPCGQMFLLGAVVNTDAINVTADNTGAKVSAKEFQ